MRIPAFISAGATALALLFAAPVSAQPACPTSSIGKVVEMVEENGGELIDLVDVRGENFDQIMVLRSGDHVVIGLARLGCVVTPPLALGKAARETDA